MLKAFEKQTVEKEKINGEKEVKSVIGPEKIEELKKKYNNLQEKHPKAEDR